MAPFVPSLPSQWLPPAPLADAAVADVAEALLSEPQLGPAKEVVATQRARSITGAAYQTFFMSVLLGWMALIRSG